MGPKQDYDLGDQCNNSAGFSVEHQLKFLVEWLDEQQMDIPLQDT